MQPQNPSHALALVLVDELARCGITDAVLAPGSRSTALAMALHDDPRVRVHVHIDERSAGFVAIGLARGAGRPAAVVTTSGSAVANLHPAVVEADMGQVPLLLLTADRPPELRHTGANQTIDQAGIFGRAPRFSVDLGVAEDLPASNAYWRAICCRAVAEAHGLSGPPGPVHLNLPFREPTVPASDDGRATAPPFAAATAGRHGRRPWVEVTRAPRLLADHHLDTLAGRLASVERGLVVLGQTDAEVEPVLDLAGHLGWPVIAEPTSNGRIRDLVVTTAHLLLGAPGFADAHRPDLVLRIGRTGLSRHLAGLLTPAVPQLLVDPHGSWHDPERAVGELLVADVAPTAAGLTQRLAVSAGSDWADRWQQAERLARAAVDEVLDADDQPTEPRTARDLPGALPDGATLVVASSMPVRDLDAHMRPRRGLRIIANRGASGIDGLVSTTLGVALANAGPAVALTGDLAFLHDQNGLLLSPDTAGMAGVFVVVDNDGGGIFHFLPQAAYTGSFERIFGTPHGRDLAEVARAHHLTYQRIDRAADLGPAAQAAVVDGGLHLLHVRTDRHANLALHRRLQAVVIRALDQLR